MQRRNVAEMAFILKAESLGLRQPLCATAASSDRPRLAVSDGDVGTV